MKEDMNSPLPAQPGKKERPPAEAWPPEDGAGPEPSGGGAAAVAMVPADRLRLQSELKQTRDQAAGLTTEMRTLKERLVMLRARTAALDQQVRTQAEELEKYHHALAYMAEGLRRDLGQVLYERGRWLLGEYQQRGLRGRVKLLPRCSEFLEFHAMFAELIHPHPDWPHVRAQLEQIRGRRWYRQFLDMQVYRRTVRNLILRLRKAA
jgi:hypothetical protein